MKHLKSVNKYFKKYKFRFLGGIFFVIISNYFAVLPPQVTGHIVTKVQEYISNQKAISSFQKGNDAFVKVIIDKVELLGFGFATLVLIYALIILLMAVIRGLLMFFMRQTIIVMSRHIEFDQKNEIYNHYQHLDVEFYKTHSTGDLMNRISEDVSRVRMYTGPAIMYLTNLVALISFALFNMIKKDASLTLYTLAPLPFLAITIYYVNTIINKKSERIQALLSKLTTNAQETFSGIRVIKSFVQEKSIFKYFSKNSEEYKSNAISLAKVEALYFPSMALLIGLSILITIAIGGMYAIKDPTKIGLVVEFVIYINMLTFPVSAIGWVASMMQRAAASQKRINEFLEIKPTINNEGSDLFSNGIIEFKSVSFTYPHSGIKALNNFSLQIKPKEKVMILGKTGSGKSTLAQLLFRFYNVSTGSISINEKNIQNIKLNELRNALSYVPQDVFLFSDSVENNIAFGLNTKTTKDEIKEAAILSKVHEEIQDFNNQYQTLIGERGVTLSGGQKQRITIARALLKPSSIVLFDDCLSAVDAKTENFIISNFNNSLKEKTCIIITHRIFTAIPFDRIIVLANGSILEEGNHESLMKLNGYYASIYQKQITQSNTVEN